MSVIGNPNIKYIYHIKGKRIVSTHRDLANNEAFKAGVDIEIMEGEKRIGVYTPQSLTYDPKTGKKL